METGVPNSTCYIDRSPGNLRVLVFVEDAQTEEELGKARPYAMKLVPAGVGVCVYRTPKSAERRTALDTLLQMQEFGAALEFLGNEEDD